MSEEQNQQSVTTEALVQAIRDNADALGLRWQLRPATVVFNTNGVTSVKYDGGDEVETRATPLVENIYADDRVMVMHVPPSNNYVVGYAVAAGQGRSPGGRVATTIRTSNTSSFTSETVMDTVTAYLIEGRTYRVSWAGAQFSTVADGMARLRIREDTVAGTELQVINVQTAAQTANQSYQARMEAEFTATDTGSKSFVATMARQTGTGSLAGNAGATNPTYFYVDYIRN